MVTIETASQRVALFLTLVLISCNTANQVSGTWDLLTIDGVPLEQAFPSRMDYPATDLQGVAIQVGDMWSERHTEASVLEIEPGGDYVLVTAGSSTVFFSPEFYVRATGRRWTGSGVPSQQQTPDTNTITGRWTTKGDSLLLVRSQAAVAASLAAGVKKASPELTEEAARAAVESMALGAAADTTVLRGTFTAARLVLRDKDGREVVYRRRQ